MKSEKIESAASNEAIETLATIGKEIVEAGQRKHASAIGCDERKAVSGMDYLVIFARIMREHGIIPTDQMSRAIQVAAGMKANNSALRQWLYETKTPSTTKDKVSRYLD